MANTRPTIKSLAEQLEISPATVSKALNGRGDVSLSTRKRVLEASQQSGYRLYSKHWVRTVGIVLSSGQELDQPTLHDFLVGVSKALAKRDFDLLVSHAELETDPKAFERLVQNGKVDGFILMRTLQQDPRAEWLLSNRVPFVTHGRTSQAHRHAWFDMDGAWAMDTAFQTLRDTGHETIAFVQAPDHYAFARDRAKGAANHTHLNVMATADEAGGYQAARELFESANAPCPTAVVCSLDTQAVGVAHWLRVHGLTIGSDVSLIGYDDIPFASAMNPKLSSFSQSATQAGERVANMLLGILDGDSPQEHHVLERPEPRFRGSSATRQLTSEQLRHKLGTLALDHNGEKQK
jgi:LacI family transcriptional regulator